MPRTLASARTKLGVQKEDEAKPSGWKRIAHAIRVIGAVLGRLVSILFFVFFVMLFATALGGGGLGGVPSGNIAVIPIEGTIVSTSRDSILGDVVKSDTISKWLEKAGETERIKAVVLEINSPGGSAVASDEIAVAVKELREKKPVVAVIRETGASGGYWVASAAERIWANRMSITGSIGVTSSRLEFAGLIEEYNVTYRRLVSAPYKDAGTPWKKMTSEEQELFQRLIGRIHEFFIIEVARNRGLSTEKVTELANGFIFLGVEAMEHGLVDEMGSRKDAVKWLEQKLNITAEVGEFEERKGLFGALSQASWHGMAALGVGLSRGLQDERPVVRV